MPRLPGLSIAGCPQHIIQRGNNRQACFFAEKDYKVYLDKINDLGTRHNVSSYAFVYQQICSFINDNCHN